MPKGKKKVAVTDHAIVRFLERVYGLNIKLVKDEIVDENVKKLMDAMKVSTGQFPAETHVVRITDGVVKTVVGSKYKKVSKGKSEILALFEGGEEE